MEREFSIRSVFLPQGLTERTKDFILALGIAFVGCIGSYFILGGSIQNMMQTSATENTSSISYQKDESLHGLDEKIRQNVRSSTGNSMLYVQGNLKVNESIQFNNLHINGIRYLIDFGNGIRSSFDQRSVSMRYNDPGIYIAQSYVWESEKWKLIAAQTLTIHP